jgi:lipopolysaccharide transport system ATP-binding protein
MAFSRGARENSPSMSEHPDSAARVVAEDVWVKFLIRYHRRDVTLRGTFVNLLGRVSGRNGRPGRERREFWALRGVSLVVEPGEILGIVGQNGSGKSTLLKTLAGIYEADRGRVQVRGKVGCLLSFGVGFNPTLSGRENIYLNGSILGLPEREIAKRLDAIVAFSELEQFIDAPVRTYSAGMRGRLGFSIATHINPDVLLLDEVLAVGDSAFRAKAGSILDRFRSDEKTVILATHNMSLVKDKCTRALWLHRGQVCAVGDPQQVVALYSESQGQKSPGAGAAHAQSG